jgi:hypothetical protein
LKIRKKVVLLAIDTLDTDRSGVMEINEIKYLYNAKNHPDIKGGKKMKRMTMENSWRHLKHNIISTEVPVT